MSQHSASPRLEALESSVSEIQERMSELVGMLRQLTTETRTAGDGRRGEDSGGARRDAAHIYSSGTRRGPLTAATGYRVTAVQDEGAGEATAARNFPVHHRAASEPADTRPGLPTGVGPMIDVRSGEARDPYLAGITAYDQGRDVLRAEFKSLPARVVPPVLKAEKGGFQKFKHEFFLKTNMLDITDHFVGQGMRAVPVGDPLKQKAVLLQEGSRMSKHSSPAKTATAAVRDEVVTAGAGGDRAVADVETTAAEEATTTALERPAVGQVVLLEPSGAAMVAVTRAAAATAATTSPLAAVSAADREATGGKTARRGRATSYSDVTGAQVTVMRRVPAHPTRQYLWWSCRYPKKTSPWKPRRSRFRRQASAV